jgi:uncharacterized protein (TIGR02145 family)
MKNILILFATFSIITYTTFGQLLKEKVIDIEGNIYHTVKIGTQVWMVENLKVKHYRNGDAILKVTDYIQWRKLETGAYSNYNNDKNITKTYGRLYNWYALNDKRNICPKGWHIPSIAEWKILISYLGGDSIAGSKLKEIGTTHWQKTNNKAYNESGFTALPGGIRDYHGAFDYIGFFGTWWSSTESEYGAWYCTMNNDDDTVKTFDTDKSYGFSIRCIKDSLTNR